MTGKKGIVAAITAVLALLATILIVNRNTVHMVYMNLTAMKKDMDESDEWSGGTTYLKVPYSTLSENQYLDLYVPDNTAEPPKLFVLIHGGGFITNDSQSRQAQLMYRYFRDQGFACASINYRLAQEAPFPGALSDVKAAVRFLRVNADKYGYDAEKIAIWGESAGGYLAVAATVTNDDEFCDVPFIGQEDIEKQPEGAKSRQQETGNHTGQSVSAKVDICVDYYGAVDLSPKYDDWKTLGIPRVVIDIANSWLHTDVLKGYSDVESFWMRKEMTELTPEEYKYCDIFSYIDENIDKDSETKFWIAHGDCDITVPILQSERLYESLSERLGEENVVYQIVKNAGHAGDIMYTDQELSQIRDYLMENLDA